MNQISVLNKPQKVIKILKTTKLRWLNYLLLQCDPSS